MTKERYINIIRKQTYLSSKKSNTGSLSLKVYFIICVLIWPLHTIFLVIFLVALKHKLSLVLQKLKCLGKQVIICSIYLSRENNLLHTCMMLQRCITGNEKTNSLANLCTILIFFCKSCCIIHSKNGEDCTL